MTRNESASNIWWRLLDPARQFAALKSNGCTAHQAYGAIARSLAGAAGQDALAAIRGDSGTLATLEHLAGEWDKLGFATPPWEPGEDAPAR